MKECFNLSLKYYAMFSFKLFSLKFNSYLVSGINCFNRCFNRFRNQFYIRSFLEINEIYNTASALYKKYL